MGNEMSHQRYFCRKFKKFERLATVQETTAADLPIAQPALGAVLWSSVNHPPEEKSQDLATGMQKKDVGRESEIAPAALSVVRTIELQDLGEAQPSAQQSETGNEPPSDRQTCAPTQDRPAAALQASGEPGETPELPLQTATEMGDREAEDVVTEQPPVESHSVVHKRPRDKLCRPSPLCRWLKKLRSPTKKAKVKPNAITGQD